MLGAAKRLHTFFPARCFAMSSADRQSYQEAVAALNSLQSNAADIERIRKHPPVDKNAGLVEFESFMNRTGMSIDDLRQMSIIHVSGTKGKGSTCALVESILSMHGIKTGFFSSPHLVEVRERIRLNGEPLSYAKFAEYFWLCYNRLQESKTETDASFPPYFRFLNLMSFHVFLQEKVDVAIVEVGIGGRYDTTNVVPDPVVCGISSLGYDHVALLGKTLREIGWHKAGIMKPGTVAFTTPQADEGMLSLAEEAERVKVPFHTCPPLSHYSPATPRIGLDGDHQKVNASLALQLCRTWMQRTGRGDLLPADCPSPSDKPSSDVATSGEATAAEASSVESPAHSSNVPVASPFSLTPLIQEGLSRARWPGRCDVIRLPKVTVFLDGAHTIRSAQACAKWFKSAADAESKSITGTTCRVLIFNSTGGRNPASLLTPLTGLGIQAAAFCPNVVSTAPATSFDMTNCMVTQDGVMAACRENFAAWGKLHESDTPDDSAVTSPMTSVILPSAQESFAWLCRNQNESFAEDAKLSDVTLPVPVRVADHVHVLVVGSLHLVGTALAVLRDCCGVEPTKR